MGHKVKGHGYGRRPVIQEGRHNMKNEVTALHEEIAETLVDLQATTRQAESYRKAWEAEKLVSKSFQIMAQEKKNARLKAFIGGAIFGVLVMIIILKLGGR